MPRRATFHVCDLRVVEQATHELIVLGDFVRLASGSPLGLVVAADDGRGEVAWLTGEGQRSTLPLVCLRPISADPTPRSKV